MSSVGYTYNPFYEPVVSERYFSRGRKYDEIEPNRNNLPKMVDAFEERIRNWYIEPTELLLEKRLGRTVRKIVRWLTGRHEGGHYAFTVASMTCLLIDALSQFRYGELTSDGGIFRKLVTHDLRSYNVTLPNPIWHYDDKHGRPLGPDRPSLRPALGSEGTRLGCHADPRSGEAKAAHASSQCAADAGVRR